jgi:hypothetical protein
MKRSHSFYTACLVAAGMLLLFSVALSGQATFSPLMNRPATVPADYAITPFGYFHPSCVQMVREGHTLLADGRVQHPDGAVDAAPLCFYPHYTSTGLMIPVNAGELRGIHAPTISGWLESVSVTTSSSYQKIYANWKVPPAPTTNDGQLLYFFPGFEDINNVISIVQPVMQWGVGYAGGGAYWLLSSWNCCISGMTWYSPLLDVNVGDMIRGSIVPTCKPGTINCPTWNIISADVTTGTKTTLAKTSADGQIWNWAFGAVSEDYGVMKCTDFPANYGLTFSVQLYDQTGTLISAPAWQGTQWITNPNPKCPFGTKISGNKETVNY